MKQAYFTVHNLEQVAAAMASETGGGRRARQVLEPSQAALLVLDLQRYFLEPDSHAYIPSAAAILPGIQRLMVAFRQLERPVICSRHTNTRENAGNMARWWQDLIDPRDPLSNLTPELQLDGTRLLEKHQYDAFLDTGLADELRSLGCSQVLVCGVMTHLCCESTARGAFMRGFEVFFCIDGTATYNAEFHRASLLNLAHGCASLVQVKEALAACQQVPGD
ncbi:MAG: isochorismatase family protein [Anaerolineales bacterium]|nr:isochorismatase family protein [Anaerolineales bacterium]